MRILANDRGDGGRSAHLIPAGVVGEDDAFVGDGQERQGSSGCLEHGDDSLPWDAPKTIDRRGCRTAAQSDSDAGEVRVRRIEALHSGWQVELCPRVEDHTADDGVRSVREVEVISCDRAGALIPRHDLRAFAAELRDVFAQRSSSRPRFWWLKPAAFGKPKMLDLKSTVASMCDWVCRTHDWGCSRARLVLPWMKSSPKSHTNFGGFFLGTDGFQTFNIRLSSLRICTGKKLGLVSAAWRVDVGFGVETKRLLGACGPDVSCLDGFY